MPGTPAHPWLDALPEDAFDRVVRLAARMLRAPVALVAFADGDRQLLWSAVGLPGTRTERAVLPLSHSFCAQVVSSGAPLVVRDAREDVRLRHAPAVLELGAVAYAGAPVHDPAGRAVGALEVVDREPREWSAEEREVVRDLAALATAELGWRLEARAERTRDVQLRRAERLASVGTLLGGVAHELNNPLAAIRSFAQLLLLDERPEEEREALEIIARESARAAKIVADLRLVARQTQQSGGAREPVDVNDVVRHVLTLRGYTLQTHNVQVHQELAPDLPPVRGDRGDIEQVVLHLVLNAEHSMSTGPGERRLILRTRPSTLGVSLQVVDNGPGIPPEHLERIFDPFWTTKEPGEGTGLGLSMVHSIVAEHGGGVRVESEVGKGAAFTVDLPRAPLPARAETPGDASPRALRVLVVDDELPIRRSLARYLERRGHRVDEAADGREALACLDAAEAARYDVVLADLRMPGLGGDRLLAALRARGGGMERRVVLITGDATSEEAREFATSGIPVLLKPFDLDEVVRVVESRGADAEPAEPGGAGTDAGNLRPHIG